MPPEVRSERDIVLLEHVEESVGPIPELLVDRLAFVLVDPEVLGHGPEFCGRYADRVLIRLDTELKDKLQTWAGDEKRTLSSLAYIILKWAEKNREELQIRIYEDSGD